MSISVLLVSGVTILYAQTNGTSTGEISIDAIEPSDVSNLKAVAGDAEVQLTWDAATDNVAVTGYKIFRGTQAVKTQGGTYDLPVIPVGNVKSYIVQNLTNDQTYYFSAAAIDAAGNESISYAKEVSATPRAGLHLAAVEDDGNPPQVKEVKTEDVITVQVIFSEPVKLPLEFPQSAFVIEKSSDKSKLAVQRAEIDARDEKGATVLLTTAPQAEGADYLLTVGIEVKDYFNNPVISGTSDTGSFKGSAKQKEGGSVLPPVDNTGNDTGEIRDLVAPEDVTALLAKIKDAQNNIVEVKWTPSKNSAGDLADQIFYQSNDKTGKAFGQGTLLGTTTSSLEVHDLAPGNWYTFKVTSKDFVGNESKGVMKSLFLPQTGPGVVAAGLTALGMGWWRRKKKNK